MNTSFAFAEQPATLVRKSRDRPGQMVDVGGRSLHVRVQGSGSPTVVFESGFHDSSESWNSVAPQVARFTRTVTYDRAGEGWSDANPNSDAESTWADLRMALDASNVDGPLVLVGHSLGGLYMLGFAYGAPDDVAGLVMVDATHEDWYARMPDRIRTIVNRQAGDAWGKIGTKVKERRVPLGNMPLSVLVAGKLPKVPRGVSQKGTESLVRELSLDLASRSTASVHRVVHSSDHYIQKKSPEAVITEIRRVVNTTRTASKNRPANGAFPQLTR